MAGVYIKGIEMPTNDEMLVIITPNGEVRYKKSVESMWNITTSIPVQPHGRLIDADELCKRVILERDEETYDAEQKNSLMHIERAYGLNMTLGIIIDSKPIIEADDKE